MCYHFIVTWKNSYSFFPGFPSKNSFLTDLDRINHSHLCVTTLFLLIPSSFPAAFLIWSSFLLHSELPEGKIMFYTSCTPATKWSAKHILHQWLSFLAESLWGVLKICTLWDEDSIGNLDLFFRKFIVWFSCSDYLRFSLVGTQ